MKKLIIIIFLCWASISWATNYYVTSTATGSGNGTQSNPWTLWEANTNAVAGDTISVAIGEYDITSKITFGTDGTSGNPIVWVGTIDADDLGLGIGATINESANSTISTVFKSTYGSNTAISISGNYNYFHKIVFQQNTDGKTLMSISGTGTILDSCAQKYPSNVSNSSNHTIYVYGDHTTFSHSSFYNGSRTIIWVRKNSGTQADFFTMEYCKLTGATHHPPIQIMPNTNSTDTTTIKRPIVRNCLFIDNPYSNIYSRYCEQFAYYNNIFINSGSPFAIDIHTGFHYPTGTPADTCNGKGGIIAYNTIIENAFVNIGFDKGINQINFLNNIFYSSLSSPDMIFRFDGDWNAIYRHNFDYNLYYFTDETMGSGNTVRGTWGTGNTSVWYHDWNSVTGQEGHTVIDQEPTFIDRNGNDLRPLNGSSPQIGIGTPITIANGFWLDITTDYSGNSRDASTPTAGAYEYTSRGPDLTPPEVIGATLLDSITLKVNFSEVLDQITAEDENNYSITNNIDIFNASLSGSEVTLQTSSHSPDSYIVTVVNVKDLAGNIIAQSNTAEYSLIPADSMVMYPIEDVFGVIQEPDHTPIKTIDGKGALSGDPDSRWAAEPMPEEIIFDLGTNRSISKTKLSFFRWNQGRVYSYSILKSDDNTNWTTIVPTASSPLQEEWSIDEFPTVEARYIKILFINNNESNWAGLWEGEIWGPQVTGVDPINELLPDSYSLSQNYPNPFNPTTNIKYSLSERSAVLLKVYDVLGNEVATLVNTTQSVGDYDINFDAANLASGLYIYTLKAGSYTSTKKMMLLK